MALNKLAFLRYRIIDACLTNRLYKYPSKSYILEKCEEKLNRKISLSTLEKDLEAMRSDAVLGFFAPIVYDKTGNYYYYADPDYSINDLPLTEVEWEALHEISALVVKMVPDERIQVFRQAIHKIDKKFRIGIAS